VPTRDAFAAEWSSTTARPDRPLGSTKQADHVTLDFADDGSGPVIYAALTRR
jgi:hypothetical protein